MTHPPTENSRSHPATDAPGQAGDNTPEYSVSELSGALKATVESSFGRVRVRAELSGVKRAASGHLYVTLKDDKAVMDGVCWRGVASRLRFQPEDGLEVVCTGKLTTYAPRSKYQMVIERMEPAGAGALMALLEERKKKLAAEGLFAAERKRPVPYMPRLIGVVTSPTGAVIRDILHRLADRFPRPVLVWPVPVQGDSAAGKIAAAIRGFNALSEGGPIPRPDVLIVARGGGSIEDLWAFNEEEVVRAAADSTIPLISAVGHETDTTLIDFASDLRAPTPTGAAEMAVPVMADLKATLADLNRRLAGQKSRLIHDRRDRVTALARALPRPQDLLGLARQKLDDLNDRLPRALGSVTERHKARLNHLTGSLSAGRLRQQARFQRDRMEAQSARLAPAYRRQLTGLGDRLAAQGRMLESLSHKRVLARGFALVRDGDGTPVTARAGLALDDAVTVTFRDGASLMTVTDPAVSLDAQDRPDTDTPPDKAAPRRRSKAQKPTPPGDDRQGSLL
ncbi:exodeoxyribonuclease VII large subunit [Yunchengibacter salinarum]|uniref:exodeoxyribonuclease VII large subunit n=1 Tax=Yunchengibacter salinarum TaxID=3133399 RepID=UPI0035B598FA